MEHPYCGSLVSKVEVEIIIGKGESYIFTLFNAYFEDIIKKALEDETAATKINELQQRIWIIMKTKFMKVWNICKKTIKKNKWKKSRSSPEIHIPRRHGNLT